jgi:hypothetical protein
MFNVSSNSLTALPAVLPSALKVLDASFNSLGGTIPPINFNLIHLNLQDNELEGGLPAFLPRNAAGRRRASRRLLWKEKITIDAMDVRRRHFLGKGPARRARLSLPSAGANAGGGSRGAANNPVASSMHPLPHVLHPSPPGQPRGEGQDPKGHPGGAGASFCCAFAQPPDRDAATKLGDGAAEPAHSDPCQQRLQRPAA